MNEERFIGQPRNAFRRLWWQSYTLAGVNQPVGDSEPLGEDELVQISNARPSHGLRAWHTLWRKRYDASRRHPVCQKPRNERARQANQTPSGLHLHGHP